MYYFARLPNKEDLECGIIVMFGDQVCIKNDSLGINTPNPNLFEKIQKDLGDTTNMCEDYLIESMKFVSEMDLAVVKGVVESYGFTENKQLDECAWG